MFELVHRDSSQLFFDKSQIKHTFEEVHSYFWYKIILVSGLFMSYN